MRTLPARASILFAVTALVLCAGPVRADQVFLSKDEALRLVLGEGCTLEYKKISLPTALLQRLEELSLAPEESDIAHQFTCTRDGRVAGYAYIDAQVGKHLPITFIVGISPNGAVTRSEIMVYREHYGVAAKERSFMNQFEGKTALDDLKIGNGIRHVSGATLSSKAISVGVRRDLEIWRYFHGVPPDA